MKKEYDFLKLKETSPVFFFYTAAILLLCALNWLVFKDSLNADFILDDHHLLTHNQQVLNQDWQQIWGSDVFAGSTKIPAPGIRLGYFRPVTLSILAWQNSMWGVEEAFYYHLTNLILHWLITLLVAGIIYHYTRQSAIALVFAALFSLNPTHIESVTWIAGLHDLWGGTFFLLGLYFYGQIWPFKISPKWNTGLSTFLFALSILTKELFILGLLLVMASDLWHKRKLTYFLAFNTFLLATYFLFRWAYVPFGGSIALPQNFERWQNLFTFSRLLWEFYLYRFFVPQEYIFIPFLRFDAIAWDEALNWLYAGLNLGLLLAAAYALYALLKNGQKMIWQITVLTLAAFILLMLPVANFAAMAPQFEQQFVFSERFIYIPSLLLAFICAYLMVELFRKTRLPNAAPLALALIVYPALTWRANQQRVQAFQTPLSIANFVATHAGSHSLVQNIFVEFREKWMQNIYQLLQEANAEADLKALHLSQQIAPLAEYVKDPNFLMSHAKLLMSNQQIPAAYDIFSKAYEWVKPLRVKNPEQNPAILKQHQFTLTYLLAHLSTLALLQNQQSDSDHWFKLCIQQSSAEENLSPLCKYRFFYAAKQALETKQASATHFLQQFSGFPVDEFLNWREQAILNQINNGTYP